MKKILLISLIFTSFGFHAMEQDPKAQTTALYNAIKNIDIDKANEEIDYLQLYFFKGKISKENFLETLQNAHRFASKMSTSIWNEKHKLLTSKSNFSLNFLNQQLENLESIQENILDIKNQLSGEESDFDIEEEIE